MRSIPKPNSGELSPYYSTYIDLVQDSVFDFLAATHAKLHALVKSVSEARAALRPAPSEWSIKEIISHRHLSDGEHLFSYRALRFVRSDATPLASFDQDAYVPAGNFNARPLASVWDEFEAVRRSTLALFHSFGDNALLRHGRALDNLISMRASLYVIAGHEQHYFVSIRDVYLPTLLRL